MTTGIYKTIDLGKVDYNGSGRCINRVTIDVKLSDGRLSMVGYVRNVRGTAIALGQCHDTIASLFPGDARVARIVEVWKRWHLNDARPGTPAQMEYLRAHPHRSYDDAVRALDDAGLLVDNGYRYGTAWLVEELPAEIVAEIASW
jgi:hypothetical protein